MEKKEITDSQKANLSKVLVTGATGLVGRELCLELLSRGWQLVIVGRQDEGHFRKNFSLPCEYFRWENPATTLPPEEALEVKAVIHLMGEPIAEGRWSNAKKQMIADSRILTTRNLVAAINKKAERESSFQIECFISTSAIGFYGDQGDTELMETSESSPGFLGKLCSDWESEAFKVVCRSVAIRVGLVLAVGGGALKKMEPLFSNGLGGPLSDGKQWMSWIHIKDLVAVYCDALSNKTVRGPMNGVSPHPVCNRDFTIELAKCLKVRAKIAAPSLALKAVFGEMAQVLLASQKVFPQVLEKNSFKFSFPTLSAALADLYSWKTSPNDHLFEAKQWVPSARDSIFPFFSSEKNLETLTPDFLKFHVVGKSTPEIQEGTEIDYKLKIHGVPAAWKSKITLWNPGHTFKDFQLRGPYKKWDHTHLFQDLAGGTLLIDRVIYQLPLASWGGEIAHPFILNDIQKIFSYRQEKIGQIFASK